MFSMIPVTEMHSESKPAKGVSSQFCTCASRQEQHLYHARLLDSSVCAEQNVFGKSKGDGNTPAVRMDVPLRRAMPERHPELSVTHGDKSLRRL